ncbi:MAG: hypothetical protein WC711_03880 [Candidatus Staskawiczbacteria bacterium]|jgi:hypothetical protein
MSETNKNHNEEALIPESLDSEGKRQEAINFIKYIIQNMAISGDKNKERDVAMGVLQKLEAGSIDPEVAVKRVWDLEKSIAEAGNSLENTLEVKKKEAHDFVFHIFHKMAVRGANDSEYGAVRDVLKRLDNNDITPEEAKKIIWNIENEKQDWR